MKIELNDDQIDEIVLQELRRHSCLIESNLKDLKRRKKLLKFEKEDKKRFEEVLDAIKIVKDYWSPPTEIST